ncbi:hypothetical protein [Methyloversatilis thermotolerans]|uniref:hypothetical protein n=1 Tax=Methyloversatilis thermotolerans TaxID=1346290 RepID=UPI00036E14D0|nr:hypothetical protein [Methyloversatilis thermotolerans]
MDALLEILGLLLIWRVTLALVLAVSCAFGLATHVESFTAGYAVLMSFAGLLAGLVWEGQREEGS